MTTGERLVTISTLEKGSAMDHFLNISMGDGGNCPPPIQLPGEIIYIYNNYKVAYLGYDISKIKYVEANSLFIKYTVPSYLKIRYKEMTNMKIRYKEMKEIKIRYIEPVTIKIDDVCKQ